MASLAVSQREAIHSVRSRKWAIAAAFAVVYLAWGGTFLAIRVAVGVVPPFLAAAIRFLTAGVLLYGFMLLRGAPRPTLREWRSLALLGTLVIFLDYSAFFWGERYVSSGTAAIIAGTIPLITGLFEMLVFRQRAFRWSALLTIVIGFCGVAVLVSGQLKGGQPIIPSLAMLGGCVAWSLGMVLSRSIPLPSSRAVASGAEMVIGGSLLLLLSAGTAPYPAHWMASRLCARLPDIHRIAAGLHLFRMAAEIRFGEQCCQPRIRQPCRGRCTRRVDAG